MAKTRDFSHVIRSELESDPKLRAEVEKQLLNFSIAKLIFNERENAGLTQKELAKLVGTHQSVIARLEDSNYGGHSLTMLWRIADVLGSELKLDFVPKNQPVKVQGLSSSTLSVTQTVVNTVEVFRSGVQAEVKFEASVNALLTAVR